VRARAETWPSKVAAPDAPSLPPSDVAPSVHIGGQTVPPGSARVVSLHLAGRADVVGAMPVWVVAGTRPGPRVTVIGAPRGFEVVAARVAAGLRAVIDPATVNGSIVVVPVLRPGGSFAARGQPVRDGAAWQFPGAPGGGRRAREAFTIFSELVVGSSLLLSLTSPEPDRVGAVTVRGDFDDPRVRGLGIRAHAAAALHLTPPAGTLVAAAREMGAIVLELSAPSHTAGDHGLMWALRGLLTAAGVWRCPVPQPPSPPGLPVVTRLTMLRAPHGGLFEPVVTAGSTVERGALLARIEPPRAPGSVEIRAPHDAVVIEAGTRPGVRARAPLFVLGRVTAAVVVRQRKRNQIIARGDGQSSGDAVVPATANGQPDPVRVGWVESISLPALGVERLRAKIDTGARTSALHVTGIKTIGTSAGPHGKAILEVTLPAGSRRGARPVVVHVQVRDYVQVRDTSGHTERRPVIETTIRLGTLERRIRVTLTNRGDMRFPMLIGRTALGADVVVDPSRRLLLRARPKPKPNRTES
jgi:predicted deacylase